MLKMKDLFSRGRQSSETGDKASSLSGIRSPQTDGTPSAGKKPSHARGSAKQAAFLSFLPKLQDIFSSKKQLVGLDIGSSSLKLIEIQENKAGYIITHFSEMPLERGIIEDGVLVDPDALTKTIKTLFKGTGLQSNAVVTSLSGHATIAKKVTFPTMEEAELNDLIHDEASKYLPFDNMDDVNYDFQILGPNEYNPNQMDVILVAARNDVIESFTEAIEDAGLTVMIMDVDTYALETMYEANYDFEPNDTVVMVNIGAGITIINVVKGSLSVFTRDFTLAGNTVTEAIQSAYNLTFEDAEDMKINGPAADEATREAFRRSLLSYAAPICTEIERSIDYFRSTSGGDSIKKILLSGGGAVIPGIVQDLMQRLQIETEVVNPFRKIVFDKKVPDSERIDEIRPIAAVVVGLALRKVGDK